VLELALRSEDLQLASENDTFALVGGWVASQPESERKAAFDQLVRCLRFHRMSGDFLALVVGQSKHRHESAYLMDACLRAFAYQSIVPGLRDTLFPCPPIDSCKPSRAPAERPVHTFEVQLELAQCQAIGAKGGQDILMGLGSGYLIFLIIEKIQQDGFAAAVGLYVRFGRNVKLDSAEDADGGAGQTVGLVGPSVVMILSAGNKTSLWRHVCTTSSAAGSRDFFSEPWEQVVRAGSAHFPEDRMTVRLEVQYVV
jgi:hypothetical protein